MQSTQLRGRFNFENALGAVAAARLLGIDEEAIARGIGSVGGVPGRFQSVDEGQDFAVIVDYAHKPARARARPAYRARAHDRSPDLRVRLRGRP